MTLESIQDKKKKLGRPPYYLRIKPNSAECEGAYWKKPKSYID